MSFSRKMTKKSKKWRGALISLALFGVAPMAFGAETRYVSTYDELKSAISEYNENLGDDYLIVLKNTIALTGNLPAITGNTDLVGVKSGSLQIEGNGYRINGGNTYRGLFIDTQEAEATVTVSNIEFTGCAASGGNGGNGAAGGGGGMGAGAAIYANSGDVVLKDVIASKNSVKGGNGGSVLQGSESYGGGGGLSGNGGNGAIAETGAANGGGLLTDGADSSVERVAGDGGVTDKDVPDSFAHYVNKTTPVGGNSLAGGGGGASIAVGGDGGLGGGGGAGGTEGGVGGFGGGGGGGSDELTAGLGGFGAGNGGYVEEVKSEQFSDTQGGGTGGGGAALGASIFVGSDANVTISVSEGSFSEIYGGSATAGQGGGGTAEDGEVIGKGIFLLNDLTIEVAEGGKYYVSDSIGGYAGSRSVKADAYGEYENMAGVVKTGEGELILNAADASSYTGNTTVKGGTLIAATEGAISSYSDVDVQKGTLQLNANQSVKGLSGGEGGLVDLNTKTLTITGDDDTEYAGAIVGDGLLLKKGVGTLTLSGDSRLDGSKGAFNTELQDGTVRVLNDGAFGNGKVYYTRTNANDQTAAISFGEGVEIANDVVLSGNSVPMILSGDSGVLSGRLSANGSSANGIELHLNSGSSLTVSNTGVTANEDGSYSINNSNNITSYKLVSGDLIAKVSSFAVTENNQDLRYWVSSIGNATITNSGKNSLSFLLDSDNAEDGIKFSNNLALESGWLTIGQSHVEDDVAQVNSLVYSGQTSGNGGLRVDVGDGATLKVIGSLNHGYTDVKSGTLDVSNASGANVNLGGLSSDGDGVVAAGSKNLVSKFDNGDLVYNGKISADGDGTTFYKDGKGALTLNLTDDSNVKSIQVVAGDFSLGENHYDGGLYQSNDFDIELWSTGKFKLATTDGATLVLNSLNASNSGSELEIGEKDELVLSSQNTSTTLAANLSGSGWLFLENVVGDDDKVASWVFSGDNSKWNGTVAAYDNNAEITLASANATSAASSLAFGAYGVLNATANSTLGSLDFDNNLTINAAKGKTLTLNALSSSAQWLDDSVLTIDGGGAVQLNEKAGKTYYGETLVTNGSSLILSGDNTADSEYGAYRRALTLSNGGSLVMDYTQQAADGVWTSLWGADVNVDGTGLISVKDVVKLQTDSKGNYSYYTGIVAIDDAINFVGEDSNELTVQVDNSYATVQLYSEIQGTGNLVKTGEGKLILDGTGEFGNVTVNSGILQLGTSASSVNDQLANSAAVISGGVLAGWSDSLGSVKLTSGVLNMLKTGTVTLNGSGNVLAMDGGTIYVNVLDEDNYTNYKTASDDATVTMKGGAIYVDTANAESELASGSTLTVVETAAGNLDANKSNYLIYDDIAGKRFVVDGDSIADGKFNLVLKDSRFSDVATTPNEKEVGSLIDSWIDSGKMDTDTNDFIGQLENEVGNNPHLLNQLTGEMRLSTLKAQVQSHNLIRQVLTQNVLPAPTSGVSATDVSAIRGQSVESDGLTGWLSALAAFGDAKSHNGTSGYDFNLLGGMVGVEVGSSATNQFGFFFSYSNMQLDTNQALGNTKLNEEQFGVYLRVTDDWGYTFGSGTIGIANYETSRAIALANYSPLFYKGSTDGWSGSAYLERGFTFSLPASNIQPYAGLQYTHLTADGYKEGGSLQTLALSSDDTDLNSLEGIIGARWMKSTLLGARVFDFNAYTNWTHEFLDASPDGRVSLVGRNDGSIRVIGNSTGRDWIYAGLGGKLHFNDAFSVFGGADVQVNDYTTYVNGHAGMTYTW